MLSNFLKIALRNLRRRAAFSFINILGLAFGLACSLLILLYIYNELSYDKHHEHADRIVRLIRSSSGLTAAPMGPAMERELVGIEQSLRIVQEDLVAIETESKNTFQEAIHFVDSSYFDLFRATVIQGETTSALKSPDSIVLTESLALRYFGTSEVIGQTLTLYLDEASTFTVRAIIEDSPAQSHFAAQVIAPIDYITNRSQRINNWNTNWLFTYALLSPGVRPEDIQRILPSFLEQHVGENSTQFFIQPLLDIRLHSAHLTHDISAQGSITAIYILGVIAVLILVIAGINYVNISTAQSINREREIGVRRVLGANRSEVIGQFLSESVLTVAIALVLGICIAFALVPVLQYAGLDILDGAILTIVSAVNTDGIAISLLLFGVILVLGLLAGSYSAFFVSSFSPIKSLNGKVSIQAVGGWFRKGLVVFQFTAAICLLVATIVVFQQMKYVQSADLGFDERQTIILEYGELLEQRHKIVKQEFGSHPGILDIAVANDIPGQQVSDFIYRPEGWTDDENLLGFDTYFIDTEYAELLELQAVEGRLFSSEISSDTSGFLINETALDLISAEMGDVWDDPIGKQLQFYLPGSNGWEVFKTGPIVGVVKDFNYASLHNEIGPLVLQVFPSAYNKVLLKVDLSELPSILPFLLDKWEVYGPPQPFSYYFLDEQFNRAYVEEEKTARIFALFTTIAILVSCLGLLGLAAISTSQRKKEIGVRKVLGAPVTWLVYLLGNEYSKLVSIAFCIAAPISFIMLNRWLEVFAYQINISVGVLLIAGFSALLLTWLTVSMITVKLALTNPIKTLRYE